MKVIFNFLKKVNTHNRIVCIQKMYDPDYTPINCGNDLDYLLSDELCLFLDIPLGSYRSRNFVGRRIAEYVLENCPNKVLTIKPTAELIKLLRLNGEDHLSLLNLQKYLRPHFLTSPDLLHPSQIPCTSANR